MFSFFKKKPAPDAVPSSVAPVESVPNAVNTAPRKAWLDKLKAGLRKTGSSIATVFTGTQIDDALYEDLEAALLMADTGTAATQHLLDDLKRRVKENKTTELQAVKALLIDALAELLKPLEKPLQIGLHKTTVVMVAGVNGAGKTTSIGKLTKHLSTHGASVLLAAADTFRAAAREQLNVWADRNTVDIVSQEGADPAAVSYDAVIAGKARGKDVVLIDTAGRLPTQLHLMAELQKIKRIIAKADGAQADNNRAAAEPPQGSTAPSGGSVTHAVVSVGAMSAPHEVLLVIDGNTGQNALMQVKAFDEALSLTGLIVTKLDGTAKGGVLAAIALWGSQRAAGAVPVYFVGVGEKVEDLETFNAQEFAQALLA
ncbi:MAG: signal recognition particle-docking protein FtsY [Polaromonas sp.]|jgi:fused signal recognition particle receptor|nr:signal recognition particle-docking protein FtsY [Polaromonas sp.]MBK7025995.1 signal recognition particle-docking protein FtsY [Polaromonas sp.]